MQSPWRADWPGDVLLTRDGTTERLDDAPANSYTLQLENLADAATVATPLLGRDDSLRQARTIAALLAVATSTLTAEFGIVPGTDASETT